MFSIGRGKDLWIYSSHNMSYWPIVDNFCGRIPVISKGHLRHHMQKVQEQSTQNDRLGECIVGVRINFELQTSPVKGSMWQETCPK
jgi:hypothetical protein